MQAPLLAKSPFSDVKAIFYSLHIVMVPLSFVLFVVGLVSVDFNVMLAGVVCLYLANVVYGFLDMRSRLLFLFLHAGIALFLLSRPVIGTLNPERTWLLSTVETTTFALTALYLSMMSLFIGMALCGAVTSWNEKEDARIKKLSPKSLFDRSFAYADCPHRENKTGRIAKFVSGLAEAVSKKDKFRYIRFAALICFLVSIAGSYCEGVIKLSYMSGLSYEDYYLISSSDHVPWVISTLKTMAPYMLCAYLATMPKKLPSTVCLGMYALSTIPMLMIGSRGDFVIAFLFAALYYVFRSIVDEDERWITRRVAVAAAVAVPVGVFAMGMWTYIRADEVANMTSIFAVFEDAFYKQGVSFSVMGYAYDVNPQIQDLGFKFFTICAYVDNIVNGFIGTTFFGVEPLPSTNSVELALQGQSYSHTMSFFAHPNYLGGEGYGSSYILEWYADFGYGGIAVGSFILAVGLYLLSRSVGRSWFWGTSALISSMAVFHMPRGAATEWIAFITTTRFWLAMFLVVIVAVVLLYVSRLGSKPRTLGFHESAVSVALNRPIRVSAHGFETLKRVEGSGKNVSNRYGIPVLKKLEDTSNEMR